MVDLMTFPCRGERSGYGQSAGGAVVQTTPPGDPQAEAYAGHMLETDFHLAHTNALRRARGGKHRLSGHLGRQFQSSCSFCAMYLTIDIRFPVTVKLVVA